MMDERNCGICEEIIKTYKVRMGSSKMKTTQIYSSDGVYRTEVGRWICDSCNSEIFSNVVSNLKDVYKKI